MFMEDVQMLADEDGGMISEQEVELERQSFVKVLRAYCDYQPATMAVIREKLKQFDALTAEHWALLYDESCESALDMTEGCHNVTDPAERARKAKRSVNQHLERMKMAVSRNTEFIYFLTEPHRQELAAEAADEQDPAARQHAIRSAPSDLDKVRSTLKQFVRDWAAEGRRERRQCYGPLLEELQRRFPARALSAQPQPERKDHRGSGESVDRSTAAAEESDERVTQSQCESSGQGEGEETRDLFVEYCHVPDDSAVEVAGDEQEDMRRQRAGVKVLCPGAGLGRLCWEAARLGFDAQGNEFSYFMLLASSFILNTPQEAECFRLYPWVHTLSNTVATDDTLRPVRVPDLLPSMLPPQPDFSMCAGDFLEVYTEPNQWDCVMTCFFVDTAHNVVEYVKTIARILRPGGCWLNLGPLLYHWADMPGEQSIELSLDQIKTVARNCGLTIEREEALEHATYCGNPTSMMQVAYRPHFFVATKK
mmetsp:Transcript_3455/g.12145  ORF Transcript_3455/g.12145 Transcript_3455/m.12145 type:complete len:480 (-) Transcript_3455:851-2290(-)